ncbi:xanthine dehydrogenase family protein molybdopterin-binding subunit [Alcaligenes endophyticus]|uniref:Molybdopterin-dependent oxidoreductase n=1 Tax=Alcaligenes endophyticus TaxID=1929088 RepID=A0ABT8EJS7_9BURK|nr:molybdopterin cofactor-binding domain-containing protein [Alcaligenes endophyticus]MCX5591855.1 molybdopterin-dependent oxidoreductase [Alcaligenes endophyticus]MDN4121545.1 molybdopterin-dependent oxidoreductase [Alcaligenes endophyticus]
MSNATNHGFSRRDFIKLGTVGGITLLLGRLPIAQALEVNSGPSSTDWIASNGKAKFRWDAVRKVTGQKNFAFDFRSEDLPGWPKQQGYAFMLKASNAEHRFEGIDLSILGDTLQPDKLVMQKDLADKGLEAPNSMGAGFYGEHILLPLGETAPLLGHPVAILFYQDFDRFQEAKRTLQFDASVVKYGAFTGTKPPANYGAGRFVRIGGATPQDTPEFAPFQNGSIKGAFHGNEVIWPPFTPDRELFVPEVIKRKRGSGFEDSLHASTLDPSIPEQAMEAAMLIAEDIKQARSNPDKIVLERHGFSQSIDPCAMEPDNCTAWYDSETRSLHIITATQSPAGVASAAAAMVKGNTQVPVERIILLTGSTVGYGSKDYSVFPYYAIAACLYSGGIPVRVANNRYEQFQLGMKRHSIEMDVTITADRKTGQFDILKGFYNCNGGGRENLSVAVSHVAARGAQSVYYFPKSDLATVAMATQAVEAGSMRGFGSLQSMTITEVMVDEIAQELAIDPIELRRRNALREGWQNTQGGVQAGDPRIIEMLDLAARHPLWTNRDQAKAQFDTANPGKRYGVGFAQVQQVYGSSGDPSILVLEFDSNGKLTMRHCAQEIGTGATTAQQVMVWQALGKAPDEVQFGVTEFPELPLTSAWADQKLQDEFSKKDPYWVPSVIPDMSSSSSVYYIGFATRQAARFLLEYSLWPAARAIWSQGAGGGPISSFDVQFSDLRIGANGLGGAGMKPIPFEQLAKKAHEMGLIAGVAVHTFSRWEWARADFDIPGVGLRNLPIDALALKYGDGAPEALKKRMTTAGYDFIKRKSATYPPAQRSSAGPTTYTPASCIVELNVNTFTGQVEVMNHHSLMDPGTIIVPELVSGQLQGGTAMGIGHALMEELPLYEDGPGDGTWNFNRYTLPRAKDVAVWTQTADYLPPLSDTSPPKGMAELGMIPIVAAISNAITHAVGKRFYDFPITPAKIKKALD